MLYVPEQHIAISICSCFRGCLHPSENTAYVHILGSWKTLCRDLEYSEKTYGHILVSWKTLCPHFEELENPRSTFLAYRLSRLNVCLMQR